MEQKKCFARVTCEAIDFEAVIVETETELVVSQAPGGSVQELGRFPRTPEGYGEAITAMLGGATVMADFVIDHGYEHGIATKKS